ncbi:MAG TPA: UDP-N-acetylmuramate dehydrogenase [Armatimonadota bacterium]|jgi:UDP-N-acetylmuramate dehydrogenase
MTLERAPQPSIQGELLRDEPMARHTSFRIGGPADLLILPACEDDVVEAIRWAAASRMPVTVLGNGTNVLVSDLGIRGVTLLIGRSLASIEIHREELRAGCGAPLMKVAFRAARAGLTGMEFAEGIPGTLGGAIFMNAGTLLGEVKDCMVDVRAVTRGGEVVTRTAAELGMAYRASRLCETRDVLLSARFLLRPASADEVQATMARMRERRHRTQPHWDRSAGCVFKNPGAGLSAGRLLDEAGAKGMSVGGAVVSDRHANFVVNAGAATAQDVVTLMGTMRELVRERDGSVLAPEIEFVGEWPEPPLGAGDTE